jgi:hypothetical protein
MTTKVKPSVLADTAVTAGTYGGSTQHTVFTVDEQGRLTYAANATPSIATSQLTGTISATQVANNQTYGINVSGNSGTVTNGVYTSGSYSDPSWLTISKSKVGLGNVDNTADASKSVSYAATAGTAGNGGVTSVNGSTGAVTVNVAATTAGLAVGAIGSYALLYTGPSTGGIEGALIAGSNLYYAAANDGNSSSRNVQPSGTWRRMGVSSGPGGASGYGTFTTVYLRVS